MRKSLIIAATGGILAIATPVLADTIVLSPEVRTGFRQYIVTENVPPATLPQSYEVSTALPGEVVLHPMPEVVVAQVPQYRDYSYVHINNRIYVVEPVNRQIVAVIED